MGKKNCVRKTIISVHRCNAVKFEGNVCEEAKVTALEEIESGQTETRFLIRSENAKYNLSVLTQDHLLSFSKVPFENLSWGGQLLHQGSTLRRGSS